MYNNQKDRIYSGKDKLCIYMVSKFSTYIWKEHVRCVSTADSQ